MKMRIFQRGLILVGLPLLLELGLVATLSGLAYQSTQERLAETRYRRFSSEIARLLGYVSSAPLVIIAAGQYQSEKFFYEYQRQQLEIRGSMAELHKITLEIPEVSSKNWAELDRSVRAILKMTNSISEMISGRASVDTTEEFQNSLSEAKKVVALHLDEMFRLSDRMVEAAQKKLDRTRHAQFDILLAAFVLNLAMAIGLALFYKNGIVNRIKTIARNTEALSRGEALAPEIGGNDEIAQFDKAFHSMLEQLATAAKNERELFENASDVICVLDSSGRFVRVNPASLKDWGLPPQEIVGKQLNDLLSPEDISVVEDGISRAKETGNPVSFEARIESSENSARVGLWSAYWSAEEQQLFCIIHDVSERKLIELARKQFLALISSDLRIPLGKISQAFNSLSELSVSSFNELGRSKLKMAQKNVQRLLSLVNDLLAVTQMESGSFEIKTAETDVRNVLVRAAADVEQLAQAKNLQIEVISCQGTCQLDADRVMQVLVNLLSNAIKFSPEGKKIILSAEKQNDAIIWRVADQGRGVPESHKNSIFEKFSQVEKQDGKRKAGTGLGLPICKQIIEKHGGTIGVQSNEGEGSTFWFSLSQTGSASPISNENSQGNIAETCASAEAQADAEQGVARGGTSAPGSGGSALEPAPPGLNKSNSAGTGIAAPVPKAKQPFGTSLPMSSKGILLVGIPVIFELAFVAVLSNSLVEMQKDRKAELLNRQMAVDASKVSKAVLYASSVVMDDSRIPWADMQLCYREWAESQRDLEKLCDDDAYAKKEFDKLIVHSRRMKAYRDNLLKQKNASSSSGVAAGLSQRLKYLPSALALSKHLRLIIQHAENKEFQFVSPEKELTNLNSQLLLLGSGVILNIGFSVGLALFFSLSISKRILIMANNADRLANDEELNPLMGGSDELADLDRSFHKTARALSEARKKERAIFDNSRDVLCIISQEGRFVSLNSAVERNWGYSRKDLLEERIDGIILPEDLEESKASLLGQFDPEKGTTLECRIKNSKGDPCHVLWSASRKSDQPNIFCVVHDITDRVALEQLRQDFLSMVSHDLRTPLTAVNGVAQIMQTGVFGPVNEGSAGCLNAIRRNVSSLLELIGDILDLEKLSAGKMELSKEAIRIDEIVSEVNKQISWLNGTLKTDITLLDDSDCLIEADKERLSQSVCNLAKFLLLRSGGEIVLSVIQDADGVELKLRDNGPPLSSGERHQLFLRVKESAAHVPVGPEGTFHADLVLPLAAKVIESHGGSVCVEETANSQNLITVFVPGHR